MNNNFDGKAIVPMLTELYGESGVFIHFDSWLLCCRICHLCSEEGGRLQGRDNLTANEV